MMYEAQRSLPTWSWRCVHACTSNTAATIDPRSEGGSCGAVSHSSASTRCARVRISMRTRGGTGSLSDVTICRSSGAYTRPLFGST